MEMKKSKGIILFIDILFLTVLCFFDQITKHLAVVYLKEQESIKLIDGVFELHYLENRGTAFGMLQNQKVFFVFNAFVVLAAIIYVLFKIPNDRKYIKLHSALVLIAAGAIGNLIDRLRFDYVVDFLYFSLINFPIFNMADIYVTCAYVYFVILLLFVYKENDLKSIIFRT